MAILRSPIIAPVALTSTPATPAMSRSRHVRSAVAIGVTLVAFGSAPTADAHPSVRTNATTRLAMDSADVAATVQSFHAALQSGDSTAVMALLSPDVVIQESGGMETRDHYAGHHLPGDIALAKALPGVRSAQRVMMTGTVAWSTSTSTTKGTYRDRQINSAGAEMMVLSKDSGRWRIRAIHWSSRTIRT